MTARFIPPTCACISGVGSSELVESGCSASSFTTEMTTDMGSYHSQQQLHSTDTAHDTPQDSPFHHTHDILHVHVHSDFSHPVTSTNTLDQLVDRELRVQRGDQVQTESQTVPGVGDQYTAGGGASEILTSAQYGGRRFHFPYDDSSVEAESQMYTGGGIGGGELRGDIQATSGDADEGWLPKWVRFIPRFSSQLPFLVIV